MTTKVAIVTGGAQGIGKGIAGALLKDGYKVGILDMNESVGKATEEEFNSQFGLKSCVFFKCDVTQPEQVKNCYEQLQELIGNISVVVNNAGILNEASWKKMIDINTTAMIDLTYIAVDKMRKDKGGKGGTIVNIASMAGMGVFPGYPVYAASKWAIVGFTKSMAISIAQAEEDWGISLLTLNPRYTGTALLEYAGKEGLEKMVVSPAVPEVPCKKLVRKDVLECGLLSPEELGDAFMKLLKDNRNGSVMRIRKDKGCPPEVKYMEQQWKEKKYGEP